MLFSIQKGRGNAQSSVAIPANQIKLFDGISRFHQMSKTQEKESIMFPGGKNMKDMMKQAQKMQADLMKAQEEAANQIIEASAGGGIVKVSMNGRYEVVAIKIDPEVVNPEDVEMLEDLLMAALREAHEKVAKASEESMSKITGNIKIPGLF
jgi:DNA-binding YbaB/EbfC family protein